MFSACSLSKHATAAAVALVVADGGARMKEVEPFDDLATVFPASPNQPVIHDNIDNDIRTIQAGRTVRVVTPRTRFEYTLTERSTWRLEATRMTMTELAAQFNLDRPVVDRTGLTGVYSIRLRWRGDNNPNPEDGPLLFTALEDQLGLKLERSSGTLEILVIDEVQQLIPD